MPRLSIPSDCIPDGATLFKTAKGLADFLRPMLERKRSSVDAKWALANLETVCGHALGEGAGPGNPDAEARVRLAQAMKGGGRYPKSPLCFSNGWAIYKAI